MDIRERVNRAREIQKERYSKFNVFDNHKIFCNAQLSDSMFSEVCSVSEDCKVLLKFAFEKLGMSARAYTRVLKVARTIADLEGSEQISEDHILEAIQYRSLDRKYWGK